MYIGNSLSFCVGHILREGPPSGPYLIISCTRMESPEEAYEEYKDTYFSSVSKEAALAALNEVWPRLIQPRMWLRSYNHLNHTVGFLTFADGLTAEEYLESFRNASYPEHAADLYEATEVVVPQILVEMKRILAA